MTAKEPQIVMRNALSFFGDLPSSLAGKSSILIDAMRYLLPLTSLRLL